TVRARGWIGAPPGENVPTLWGVPSAGWADPPCPATPWLPATTRMSPRSRGGMLRPCHWASHTTTSSSRPRLPGGLVSWRWRPSATAAALRSPGGKSRHAARRSSSDEKMGDAVSVPSTGGRMVTGRTLFGRPELGVVSVRCPAKVALTCHDAQYHPVCGEDRGGWRHAGARDVAGHLAQPARGGFERCRAFLYAAAGPRCCDHYRRRH